jgi:hypothetical protein
LTSCDLWNHVPFHQPLKVGLSKPCVFLYNSPIAFESCLSRSTFRTPISHVQSTEGAKVGGRSRSYGRKEQFSVRSGHISEMLLDKLYPSNMVTKSKCGLKCAHLPTPPTHDSKSCVIGNGRRLVRSRTLASKCPSVYHISSTIP